jgi:hypothetical protein
LKIPTDVRNNVHIDPQGEQKDDLAIAQPADGRTLFCSLCGWSSSTPTEVTSGGRQAAQPAATGPSPPDRNSCSFPDAASTQFGRQQILPEELHPKLTRQIHQKEEIDV